eukprot:Blabericola_migrator_1__833@NODE_1205_length_5111_cov_152_599722_g817_i0_p1_GENE_NODE_1205_length_5111_cov_152_599722_g817_i0NODE_1205_length_5111_cov_152_599722_g817_i0_p1_ORF_typecomplete_len850_score95_42Zn_ribbon_SprT/PF17283_2/0_4zinc_ribbon_9/PF14369_6/66zinc_ribbon_9/PF14369_6/36_NODE_1205_length_5111_cov_152_599722_g817_i017124261
MQTSQSVSASDWASSHQPLPQQKGQFLHHQAYFNVRLSSAFDAASPATPTTEGGDLPHSKTASPMSSSGSFHSGGGEDENDSRRRKDCLPISAPEGAVEDLSHSAGNPERMPDVSLASGRSSETHRAAMEMISNTASPLCEIPPAALSETALNAAAENAYYILAEAAAAAAVAGARLKEEVEDATAICSDGGCSSPQVQRAVTCLPGTDGSSSEVTHGGGGRPLLDPITSSQVDALTALRAGSSSASPRLPTTSGSSGQSLCNPNIYLQGKNPGGENDLPEHHYQSNNRHLTLNGSLGTSVEDRLCADAPHLNSASQSSGAHNSSSMKTEQSAAAYALIPNSQSDDRAEAQTADHYNAAQDASAAYSTPRSLLSMSYLPSAATASRTLGPTDSPYTSAQQSLTPYQPALYPSSDSAPTSQKAVAFLAGPRERICVLGNPIEMCPRCRQEGFSSSSWRPHRHIGELKIRYICERHFEDLESPHHFDIPLCPLCNNVLYLYEFNALLGVSNARRLHKYVLKCSSRHVLPLLDLFCQTKKGGDRCNANFKLQWCYGTMVKRCESQKNRDHDLWWVRYKNEWKQRRTIIRYKKDFLSHLSDTQRGLLLGIGLEGEPPPDPKGTLGPTFDALISSSGGSPAGPKIKKRSAEKMAFSQLTRSSMDDDSYDRGDHPQYPSSKRRQQSSGDSSMFYANPLQAYSLLAAAGLTSARPSPPTPPPDSSASTAACKYALYAGSSSPAATSAEGGEDLHSKQQPPYRSPPTSSSPSDAPVYNGGFPLEFAPNQVVTGTPMNDLQPARNGRSPVAVSVTGDICQPAARSAVTLGGSRAAGDLVSGLIEDQHDGSSGGSTAPI